jgi:hypothetical protein
MNEHEVVAEFYTQEIPGFDELQNDLWNAINLAVIDYTFYSDHSVDNTAKLQAVLATFKDRTVEVYQED